MKERCGNVSMCFYCNQNLKSRFWHNWYHVATFSSVGGYLVASHILWNKILDVNLKILPLQFQFRWLITLMDHLALTPHTAAFITDWTHSLYKILFLASGRFHESVVMAAQWAVWTKQAVVGNRDWTILKYFNVTIISSSGLTGNVNFYKWNGDSQQLHKTAWEHQQ